MKVLRVFTSRMDADIAKGFLASCGIMAFVSSDDQGGLDPALRAQLGAKLSVSDNDFDQANLILTELEKKSPLSEGEVTGSSDEDT